jgi:hypothetical protein
MRWTIDIVSHAEIIRLSSERQWLNKFKGKDSAETSLGARQSVLGMSSS